MHVLIVEDEPVISERLQRQVSEILGTKLDKLKYFDNLDDAQEYIAEQSIDLLFLDLNLQGEDGFELLGSLTASSFHTIIVSAYADKAIKAFEYSILDFVAKPFTKQRLEQALNRVMDISLRQDYAVRYLSVKLAGVIKLIEIGQIDYIQASGHYSELVVNDDIYLHDKTIQKLLALLPPNFEQIHRSYIVNMNKVSSLFGEPGSKYKLVLKNGQQLPISRSRFVEIKRKLER
jgi:two-component system, LytTR family, response regulator LytT